MAGLLFGKNHIFAGAEICVPAYENRAFRETENSGIPVLKLKLK